MTFVLHLMLFFRQAHLLVMHLPVQLHFMITNTVVGLWQLAASRSVTALAVFTVNVCVYDLRSPLWYCPLREPYADAKQYVKYTIPQTSVTWHGSCFNLHVVRSAFGIATVTYSPSWKFLMFIDANHYWSTPVRLCTKIHKQAAKGRGLMILNSRLHTNEIQDYFNKNNFITTPTPIIHNTITHNIHLSLDDWLFSTQACFASRSIAGVASNWWQPLSKFILHCR